VQTSGNIHKALPVVSMGYHCVLLEMVDIKTAAENNQISHTVIPVQIGYLFNLQC
jgi:hypothetical protein